MRLDSVRELKSEWSQLFLTPAARRRVAHAMAFEAGRMQELPSAPTLALGVAPGSNGSDFRLAVRLQRRSAAAAIHLEELHERSRGEIDVRFVGRIRKRTWFTDRHRPIQMGISVGHFRITAGTLGAFVTGPRGRPRILSNNHVLADENRGAKGDAILQPGAIDGGLKRDRIGGLDRSVKLKPAGTNAIDAALATIDDGVETRIGVLRGTRAKAAGAAPEDTAIELVEKWGRTTGHTRGRVTAFELDNVVVGYEIGNLRFDGQIEIEAAGATPFSEGGDSGSLIMTAGEHLGVALLFAGSQTGGRRNLGLTYANPIAPVLKALGVALVA
ncbi:MAG TPA: hypothetical protein VK646_03930 [Actinomycetota bacterium]|nr:hypothetical protein [Actinomycetota bacterium]